MKIDFDMIPRSVTALAKRSILDCIGVTLAGSKVSPLNKLVTNYLQEVGGSRKCTIIGTKMRSSPPNAALANGIFGHVLDYDDISWVYSGHFSVVLLPAILATAETSESNGKDVLTAYSLGLQVMGKLGGAMVSGGHHYEKGWHATSTIGTFGATVAASRILGLNRSQTVSALGLAAASASGLRSNFGTMAKSFQAGRAAQDGVAAAMLAGQGMTASDEAIDGKFGFCEATSTLRDFRILRVLKEPWAVLDPRGGVILKRYPVIGGGLGAIESALSLIIQGNLSRESIRAITCEVSDSSSFLSRRPRTGLEGKFSPQFWIALAVLQRAVRIDDFSDNKVNAPAIVDLMDRITVQERHVGRESKAIKVLIETTDGRHYEKEMSPPPGSPGNPLTNKDLIQKFTECASYSGVSVERIRRIISVVHSLHRLRNIHELTRCLQTGV